MALVLLLFWAIMFSNTPQKVSGNEKLLFLSLAAEIDDIAKITAKFNLSYNEIYVSIFGRHNIANPMDVDSLASHYAKLKAFSHVSNDVIECDSPVCESIWKDQLSKPKYDMLVKLTNISNISPRLRYYFEAEILELIGQPPYHCKEYIRIQDKYCTLFMHLVKSELMGLAVIALEYLLKPDQRIDNNTWVDHKAINVLHVDDYLATASDLMAAAIYPQLKNCHILFFIRSQCNKLHKRLEASYKEDWLNIKK